MEISCQDIRLPLPAGAAGNVLSSSRHHHSISWPAQSRYLPLSAMVVPSMMASSCLTASSRLNSFSGGTFCSPRRARQRAGLDSGKETEPGSTCRHRHCITTHSDTYTHTAGQQMPRRQRRPPPVHTIGPSFAPRGPAAHLPFGRALTGQCPLSPGAAGWRPPAACGARTPTTCTWSAAVGQGEGAQVMRRQAGRQA